MLRLEILKPHNLGSRFLRLAVRGVFGFFPEGMSIGFVKTPFRLASYTDCIKQLMRATSEWSKGEVELFASYVSAQNECRF